MGRIYQGGGTGYVEVPGGGGGSAVAGLSLVDVATFFTATKVKTDTQIAVTDPITITDGQTIVVFANANLINASAAPNSTQFALFVNGASGPTNGPRLATPTIDIDDSFPLVASAAFQGLPAGTYTIGLYIEQGKIMPPFPWDVGDWEMITLVG